MQPKYKKPRYKADDPAVYKELVKIARNLPVVPALDKHGKPVYKQIPSGAIKGSDLPKEAQEKLGNKFDPKKFYTAPSQPQLRYQNHEVALIYDYEQFAWKGVDSYIESVNKYVKVLEEAEALAKKIEADKKAGR